MSDPFAAPSWNLDQALLWIATRDPKLVLSAEDPVSRHNQPETTWPMEAVWSHIEGAPLPSVEQVLLDALQTGAITARNDNGEISPAWFDSAQFEGEGPSGRLFMFRYSRSRDPERFNEYPRFEPKQLRNLFPDPGRSRIVGLIETARTGGTFKNFPNNESMYATEEVPEPPPATDRLTPEMQPAVGLTDKMVAVREAACIVWPPAGTPPIGTNWQVRDRLINEELKKTGRTASPATIRRAFKGWHSDRD